jgi:hypothetical protein
MIDFTPVSEIKRHQPPDQSNKNQERHATMTSGYGGVSSGWSVFGVANPSNNTSTGRN